MKPRSPVLGYNHNVRYAGRLWHVQTEDSGAQNPHIFTHLFNDGTILASKRLDYDGTSDVGVVQKLMQAQHKAMLRDLKRGLLDEKIEQRFGPLVHEIVAEEPSEAERLFGSELFDAPAAEPSAAAASEPAAAARATSTSMPATAVPSSPAASPPSPAASPPANAPAPANVPPALAVERTPTRAAEPTAPPRVAVPRVAIPAPPAPPARPDATPAGAGNSKRPPSYPSLTPARPSVAVPAGRTAPPAPAAPPSTSARRPTPTQPYGGKPTAEGVVVTRPSVIVGDSPAASRFPAPAARAPVPDKPAPPIDNIFGGDAMAEKSLDEVILAYLSEDLKDD